MPRLRWKARLSAQDLAPLVTIARNSIAAIQAAIQAQHAFVPYNAGGAQQAVTTVNWPPAGPNAYATTMQQHSEMVALAASTAAPPPPPIWQVDAAGHAVANNGQAIGGANYFTNLPHCGYCTVMLWVLDLPLGAPTDGRYNLAVNLGYTVPANVFYNINVLARLVNGNVGGNAALIVIKQLVNAFIQNAPATWALQVGPLFVTDAAVVAVPPAGVEILDWNAAIGHQVDVDDPHFRQNTLLTTLWKIVFKGIYQNVQ